MHRFRFSDYIICAFGYFWELRNAELCFTKFSKPWKTELKIK
ncbi:hypothetical protein FHS10_003256 [Mucilaginibacter dorajii]|nr:hypothetical protein [Mucilaginibacter dorajii]